MGAAGTHWRKVSLRRTSRWEASKANRSFSRQRPSCQEPVGACGGDGRLRPSPRRNGLFCEQTAGDLKLLLSAQRGHSVSSYLSPLGHLGASLHLSLLPGSPQSGPLRAPLTQLWALRPQGCWAGPAPTCLRAAAPLWREGRRDPTVHQRAWEYGLSQGGMGRGRPLRFPREPGLGVRTGGGGHLGSPACLPPGRPRAGLAVGKNKFKKTCSGNSMTVLPRPWARNPGPPGEKLKVGLERLC